MSERQRVPREVTVAHERLDVSIPGLVHPDWERTIPWLVQGTTTRGAGRDAFDLGLHADASPPDVVRRNWTRLLRSTGMHGATLSPQVHEATVRVQRGGAEGLRSAESCDGHLTDVPGVLLAVTVADCVPVFVVAPERRAVAVLHAGWRGTAAGVLENGLAVLEAAFGVAPAEVRVHLGPSICGRCYEVGPEVFAALRQRVPQAPRPIDLRALLSERAEAAGVPRSGISISAHCTRCTDSGLFSHRGGDGERQVGYVGILP